MSRLRKTLANINKNASISKNRDKVENSLDEILKMEIKRLAEKNGLKYNDGMFNLIIHDPDYDKINLKLDEVFEILDNILEDWEENTRFNEFKKNMQDEIDNEDQ